MAKTSGATVRLVLKKNRCNANGENPIYLVVCWHSRKEKSTGVYVSERYWNASKEEIRKGFPNAVSLNAMLYGLKHKIVERRQRFEASGIQYSVSMLLDYSEQSTVVSSSYFDLTESYIIQKALNVNSARLYRYTYRVLKNHFGRDNFLIGEITLPVIKRLINDLNVGDNSIRGICGRIAAIWHYAEEKGLVNSNSYPFKEWKYTQKYQKLNRVYYLESSNLIKLKEWFLSRCINVSGELYSFKDGIEDKLMERSSKEFSCLLFLASFLLNGASPIDVALLRADNCSRIAVDGIDYWKVSFKRRKTGMSVNCLLRRDKLTMICFEHFLRFSNYYIYPILKKGLTDKQINNAVSKVTGYASKHLKEICSEINEATIKNNVENNSNEPLIDVNQMTLYVARHSKANDYLSHPGATIHGLATLMGRSVSGLDAYVHEIRNDKDLAYAESLSSI